MSLTLINTNGMFKKNSLLIVLLFFSCDLLPQKPFSKKDLMLLQKSYGVVIDSFVEKKPSHFVLIDSSDNAAIKEVDFSELAKDPNLDSSWIKFLLLADSKKTTLQKIKLEKIKTIHTVRYYNRDTIFKIQRKNHNVGSGIVDPYGWIDGLMSVSTPILAEKKDKIIIEVNYTRDELDGKGGIYLLEKRRNGRWVVIKYVRTWVS